MAKATSSSWSEAQRWVLALPAILGEINEADHTLLGGFPRPTGSADASSLLRTAWDVQSPEQVEATLQRLFGTDRPELLGWELGRAASVAGWAYVAYLLDAPAAWSWMMKAAAKVQASFDSWAAFAGSYSRGRDAWRGKRPRTKDDDEVRTVIERLLSSKQSPWPALPWKTPLDGAPPPVPAQRTLLVRPRTTIAATLREAQDGDRIAMPAGVYRESLVLEKSVELVAEGEGEVVLENDAEPVVTVDDAGVVLVGLTLRTRPPKGKKKEGVTAVHASGGFLRLERCVVTATKFGLDLLHEDADVQLEASRVSSCASVGALIEGGAFVARGSTFEGNGDANLQIGGESRAWLSTVKIVGSPGSGLHAHAEADVTLRDCDVADNAGGGLLVRDRAKASIASCRFRGNAFTNVELSSASETTLSASAIEEGTGYGLHVRGKSGAMVRDVTIAGTALACVCVDGGRPTIEDSTFTGSGQSGLFVLGGSRPKLSRCRIEKSGGSGVAVKAEADPELRDCVITGSDGDGVLVQESGRGRFSRCVITGSIEAGVRVLTKGDPLFTACRIEDSAQDGVVVGQGGKGRFVDCTIQKNDLGLYIGEEGSPGVRGGHIQDNRGDGVHVARASSLTLEDCEVSGNEVNVRLEGAGMHIARCRVHDGRSDGIFVGAATRVRIEDCDVYANTASGIDVADKSAPVVLRCHVHDNVNDLSFHDQGHGTFEDGAIGGGTGWALLAEGGSKPKLRRMKIRKGKKGDVSHDAKSKPVLEDCELGAGEDFVIAALQAQAALPGTLGDRLARLDALLAATRPDAAQAMNGGASDASLEELSRVVLGGKPLPEAVSTFFRWHDGQSSVASLRKDDNRTPMSIAEAIEAWTFLCDPDEDVLQPWSRSWLPLFANGAGDHLCIVISGKQAGTLVEYWHADAERETKYPSLEAWADEVIAALGK